MPVAYAGCRRRKRKFAVMLSADDVIYLVIVSALRELGSTRKCGWRDQLPVCAVVR